MKTVILKIGLSLFLMVQLNVATAQYQSLFGDTQTSWNIIKGNMWGIGTDSLVTVSDTTINSLNYKKILYYDISSSNAQIEPIVGFLREDSFQGKAWYFNTTDTTEQLIMDLSLSIADTFYVGGSWNAYPGYHPVDSIWIESGRKHVRLDLVNSYGAVGHNDKVIFIEGVGTNIGIGYQDVYYADNFPYLLCAYKNTDLVYQNAHPEFMGNCNYTTVGVDDYPERSALKIYPNPSSAGEVTIEYKNENSKYLTVAIYSNNGKLMLSQQTTSFENTRVNTHDFPAGIYFISIQNEKGVVATKKWVKTR